MIEFGANLKRAREKYLPGISRNRAAQMALLSHSQLKAIEEGGDFQFSTLIRMCEAWKIPIRELFQYPEKKEALGKKRVSLGG